MICLQLADAAGLAWAQQQVSERHYLRAPVDSRCSVLGYLVLLGGERVGCLLFGRPEATRCYTGGLTYGSQADVAAGRAFFDRWEIVNLARVWLAPSIQSGGERFVPCAATRAVGAALRRVAFDYLQRFPPVYPDEPWQLQMCLSYCDTRQPGHHGTIYRAAGFWRVRVNEEGIETWARPLRRLSGRERVAVLRLSAQSARGRRYRSQRAVAVEQGAIEL